MVVIVAVGGGGCLVVVLISSVVQCWLLKERKEGRKERLEQYISKHQSQNTISINHQCFLTTWLYSFTLEIE